MHVATHRDNGHYQVGQCSILVVQLNAVTMCMAHIRCMTVYTDNTQEVHIYNA